MFTVLLFGRSSAPYIFTTLFRPLVKHCRSRGIRSVVYLDDGLDVEPNEALSSTNSNIIKSDLASAGFLANMNKCVGILFKLSHGWALFGIEFRVSLALLKPGCRRA